MLLIQISTGLAWLQSFVVEGDDINQDYDTLISDYVMNHQDEFDLETYEELKSQYSDPIYVEDPENYQTAIDDFHYPINGGEYYIGQIQFIGKWFTNETYKQLKSVIQDFYSVDRNGTFETWEKELINHEMTWKETIKEMKDLIQRWKNDTEDGYHDDLLTEVEKLENMMQGDNV